MNWRIAKSAFFLLASPGVLLFPKDFGAPHWLTIVLFIAWVAWATWELQ